MNKQGELYLRRVTCAAALWTGAILAASANAKDVAFDFQTIGPVPFYRPAITNVQIVDLDKDGIVDVVACDPQRNSVFCYHRMPDGHWDEQVLADNLLAPAHATVVDLDKDGDNDVLVSVLGDLYPNDEVIGSLVLLENQNGKFVKKVLLDDVRRVVDAQVGDFDGDGDLDIAVAVFGYARGQILWLENLGDGKFRDHELMWAPGTIHVPVADFDGDGDPDITAVVSQDEEEVWGFENLGGGKFAPHRLWSTLNYDIGTAGLVKADLDGDGDVDLLLPLGDNLEDKYSFPQPYHGCLWLENKGNWKFEAHRIATFPGTYAAAAGDLDGDGDQDVVLCSMVNDWDSPDAASLIWLENDGKQNFTPHTITNDPIMLVTLACGDLNADGRPDIVGGGLHIFGPNERLGRVSGWLSSNGASAKEKTPATAAVTTKKAAADPAVPIAKLSLLDSMTRQEIQGIYDKLAAKVAAKQDTADDWLTMGEVYYAYGFFPPATRCFQQAAERKPDLFLANYLYGVGLQRIGKISEAIDQLRRTLPLSQKEKPWVWHLIGECSLRLENEADAESAFVQAGNNAASLARLARLRLKQGRAKDAIPALTALEKLQPKEIETYILRTRAAADLGDTSAAQRYRDRAEYNSQGMQLDPIMSLVMKVRNQYGACKLDEQAKSLYQQKMWEQAEAAYRPVVEARGDAADLLGLASTEYQLRRPEKTRELLQKRIKQHGNNGPTALLFGESYLLTDEPEKSRRIWEAMAPVSRMPELYRRMGEYYEIEGKPTEADKQHAIEAEIVGIRYLRQVNPAAKNTLLAAVALNPRLPRAWFYLGEIYRLEGNNAAARDAYQKVLELDPNHGRAIEALARVSK